MKFIRCLLASGAMALATDAPAQIGPTGSIKVLVGFPAGGPPDLAARKIAARLAEQLGTGVVVENRPGASGTIAAAAVAHAAPDGRTLLFGVAANLAVAPATMKTAPYDPVRDFTPIVEVARGPYVWMVRADAPARNLSEFVAWARSSPARLNYATPGPATVHHIATEMLKQATGIDMVHVPYRTTLYQPLLAGEVQAAFDSLPGPLPHIAGGKVRALAVTGSRRLARLAEVPTLAELGVRDMELSSWWGFVGPAGMPRPLVTQLNADLRRAMADPDLVAAMTGWGIELSPGSPEEFGRFIASEDARWKREVARIALPLE